MKWLFTLFTFCCLTLHAASSSSPPNNPSPPPFISNLLPIVLVNNTNLPDNQVYIVVTGRNNSNGNQSFLNINSSGIGSLVTATPGDNALNHTKSLDQLPKTKEGFVFYTPKMNSGTIFFSVNNPLNMPVNPPNAIVQPNFTSSADSNYNTIFDIFEFTYTPSGSIYANTTAVTFFSIPLYGYISTANPGSNSTTGIYQSRNTVWNTVNKLFSAAPEGSQWQNLFLRNGSTVLRLLSPAKAMTAATSLMDSNYLDNSAAYGYSFIQDIWSGPNSYYRNYPLVMKVPAGSLETYKGVINSDNTITFTSSPSGYKVVFAAPKTTGFTTTEAIFSGLPLHISDTSPGQADGIQLSKLFEEAIIAGLLPTPKPFSNEYLAARQSNFYKLATYLSAQGKATGPWYDLYSKALHSLGPIYTFAYDEPLWPNVQIVSGSFNPTKTYLGITIGSLTD